MILAVDPAIATLGWAVVTPRTGRVVDLGVRIANPNPRRPKNEDRLDRTHAHADALVDLAREHGCDRIVAEAVSLPVRGKANAAASMFLTWGMLVGVARALGLPRPAQVAAKTWQRAVVPDAGARVEYARVERALAAFAEGQVGGTLLAIPKGRRNHALDAVGVGVFAALRMAA